MVNITICNKHRLMIEMRKGHTQPPTGPEDFFFFLQDTVCFILKSFSDLLP